MTNPIRTTAPVGAALALALMGSTAISSHAWADTAAAAAPAASSVSEVVVTAEKRESTVQKTAASVSVMTGQQLQAAGVTSVSELVGLLPGISIKTSGPGQTEFEMRGLTSTGGESPTVGFYLDDTPLTPPAMAQNGKVVIDPDLYDLARIEVLRGPQGTLYGAGSMGGTIRLVTNAPDPSHFADSFELIGSGTEGGGFNRTESGMVNVPLVQDSLALRVSATDEHNDGWIDRIVLNPFPLETNDSTTRGDVLAAPVEAKFNDVNWEQLDNVRVQLLGQVNDKLTITPSFFTQTITQGGPNTIDVPPGTEAHYQPYNVPEPFSDTFTLESLSAQYDLGLAKLSSATSYWDRRQFQTQDISEAMQDYIGSYFGPAADWPYSAFGAGSISEDDQSHQFAEEVRLASQGAGPLQWLVGGFYSNFSATSHVYSYYPVGGGFDDLFGTTNLADNHRYIQLDQTAAFGEATYAFTDQLKATAGLRWFSYDSHAVTQVSGVSANGTSAPLTSNAANTGVTPKFDFTYQPTGDFNLYFTAAEGFRPGGPNSPIPSPPCPTAPTEFGPDSVWSYELGEKARMLDQRLVVNGDVYFEDWSGVQQEIAPACGFKYTTNAGTAHVTGAEIEVFFRITDEITLSQNAGYTHAVIASATPGSGLVVGQRLQDVPDWTANTTLEFDHPINARYTLFARVNNAYVGSMQDVTFGLNTLPGYDLVDLRGGVMSGPWKATLFVSNATNKIAYLADTGALSANVPIFNRVAVSQPRTYGLDLTYKY
ncbi:MAG TPA: TonB-dependent receptor [Caulobacteraceae bacterium]|nr:TonB-dependent receptor [Caulobacteraceae bacterium]